VLLRDGYRCRVPGCPNRIWLDLHHLHFWSAGGGHQVDNLVTLCTRHHDLVHRGKLRAERSVDGSLGWRDGHGRALRP
jgi:5-methylcytosine-specific restriction endonuclease McrA